MRCVLLSLAGLPLLAIANPVASPAEAKAPVVIDAAKVGTLEPSEWVSPSGAIHSIFLREPEPSSSTPRSLTERALDTLSELSKRIVYGPICVGGHTAPVTSDCAMVISEFNAVANQSIQLGVNYCRSIQYHNCLGYICATKCNSLHTSNAFVASKLQNIKNSCVTSKGQAGYYHSTGGSGYSKYDIGLERYATELTPYEPC